jgi:hypothetical protein
MAGAEYWNALHRPENPPFHQTGRFLGEQGPPGPAGQAGPAGPSASTGLHVVRQDNCENNNCTLACGSGETLASITCPSGTVSISKNGEVETATCGNPQGPALALCLK